MNQNDSEIYHSAALIFNFWGSEVWARWCPRAGSGHGGVRGGVYDEDFDKIEIVFILVFHDGYVSDFLIFNLEKSDLWRKTTLCYLLNEKLESLEMSFT